MEYPHKPLRIRILGNGDEFRVQVKTLLGWADHYEDWTCQYCDIPHNWDTREEARDFIKQTYGSHVRIEPREWETV